MIFGITLNKLEGLKDKPDLKLNWFTRWQFGQTKVKKYELNNIKELAFDKFVDCENFIEIEQFKDFCTIFVKRKWWQTIYLHEMESIILEYARQKAEIIEENDFIELSKFIKELADYKFEDYSYSLITRRISK